MSDCGKIESAYKGLTPQSKPDDAGALIEALKDVNQSRILNSDFYKQSEAKAKQLQSDGSYSLALVPDGDSNAILTLTQDGGRPRSITLHEEDRTETLFFDIGSGRPSVDAVAIKCSGKGIQTDKILGRDGQTRRQFIRLPNHIVIEAEPDGRPNEIQPF